MHIMIVTANMQAGGAERVIAQLLNEWSKKNTKCTLVTLHKQASWYALAPDVNLVQIGQLNSNHYVDKFRKYLEVRRIVKREKPDIVLSFPEEIGIFVIGALVGTRTSVVVSERNNPWKMPNKKITRLARKLMYPLADGIIFQTQKAATFFSKSIQKKGIVLCNPLDILRVPEPYQGERAKIIVGAGRLVKQKNFHLLIDAFAHFHRTHPDYSLVIYGEGCMRNELQKTALQKLPPDCVAFPGTVPDLPQRIVSASAFVLSSDYEGVPNVLIEAMAMGIPCVATDCEPGGAAELLENEKNGFLVPIGDAQKLAACLCEIVDNTDLAHRFSEESVKIKERLNAELVCEQWLRYLESVKEKAR